MARTKSGSLHEAILLAAKELLLEHGFASVSMQDVADAAGTTKATVYSHFESKERLAEAVLNAVAGWAIEALGSLDPALPPADALAAYLARFLAIVTSGNGVRIQRYALAEAGRDPEGLTRLYGGVNRHAVAEISAFLIARGLGGLDPERVAALLDDATAAARLAALFDAAKLRHETVQEALEAAPPPHRAVVGTVQRFLDALTRERG
jgi:TetR/AcrR family transcriptional regulator, mexJK operon transcriptional repressor